MKKETKDELKEIIDNLEDDDNILLITNNICCLKGVFRDIFRNIILACLKNDDVNNLMQLFKKL